MKKNLIISALFIILSSIALGKTVTTGRGFGFKDYITVEVSREGDKIESIEVIEYKDTEKYAEPAFSVLIEDIIEGQSVDVDDFAGATGSSMGLRIAVEDALNK